MQHSCTFANSWLGCWGLHVLTFAGELLRGDGPVLLVLGATEVHSLKVGTLVNVVRLELFLRLVRLTGSSTAPYLIQLVFK